MLETNVDDVSPQIIGACMDRAFTGCTGLLFHTDSDEEEPTGRVVVDTL
jgi:uncharacterized protein (DUF111 family)